MQPRKMSTANVATNTRKQLLLATAVTVMVLLFAAVGYAGYIVYAAFFVSPYYQPISGPVQVGSEWVEITPPEPLKSVNSQQFVSLKIQGVDLWDDANKTAITYEDGKTVTYVDGKQGKIEAYLFDDKNQSYELEIAGVGGGVDLTRKLPPFTTDAPPTRGPYFPRNRVYTKLKIRSDVPIHPEKIEWVCTNPK